MGVTHSAKPPFRADQVGSLLRPLELRAAREGRYDAGALRELEDRSIREVIRLQESAGLHAITDGEYRRSSFHADFIEKLDGARAAGRLAVEDTVSGLDENRAVTGKLFAPRAFTIFGKLRHARPIEVENFKFVKASTQRTPKQTMPSPTMLLRGGRAAVSSEAYPDLEEFYTDVARVYREELRQLGEAGCRYVQLDDTNFAFLCDPKLADTFRRDGYDPDEMPERFAKLINSVIAGRPVGMVVGIHLCRGNSMGQWAAQGGYEPVADVLLNRVDVDAYFLEYDDETCSSAASTRRRDTCRLRICASARSAASRAHSAGTRSRKKTSGTNWSEWSRWQRRFGAAPGEGFERFLRCNVLPGGLEEAHSLGTQNERPKSENFMQ